MESRKTNTKPFATKHRCVLYSLAPSSPMVSTHCILHAWLDRVTKPLHSHLIKVFTNYCADKLQLQGPFCPRDRRNLLTARQWSIVSAVCLVHWIMNELCKQVYVSFFHLLRICHDVKLWMHSDGKHKVVKLQAESKIMYLSKFASISVYTENKRICLQVRSTPIFMFYSKS